MLGDGVQGYLAQKKTYPPRTLLHAGGSWAEGRFLMGEAPLYSQAPRAARSGGRDSVKSLQSSCTGLYPQARRIPLATCVGSDRGRSQIHGNSGSPSAAERIWHT